MIEDSELISLDEADPTGPSDVSTTHWSPDFVTDPKNDHLGRFRGSEMKSYTWPGAQPMDTASVRVMRVPVVTAYLSIAWRGHLGRYRDRTRAVCRVKANEAEPETRGNSKEVVK